MKTAYWFICLLGITAPLIAQNKYTQLQEATAKLLADSQMKHAILGFSVVKTSTGEKVFSYQEQIGLAPASCQKIFTSVAALELLGKNFTYQTTYGFSGSVIDGVLHGNIYIAGSGDPSFASSRYTQTKNDIVFIKWVSLLKGMGIKKIDGKIIGLVGKWDNKILPGGWIWDDIGNYYGAGNSALNWHENQYELLLQSGKSIGDSVVILSAKPKPEGIFLKSELTAAAAGSGDNAYIYLSPYAAQGFIRGTIPVNQNAFSIAGSFPNPASQFLASFGTLLDSAKIDHNGYQINSLVLLLLCT